MKISITWLNDYIKTGVPVDRLIHKLTMAGLEVEKTETVAGDTVLELEITPNRPDCLNMLGMAREVSAILNKTVKKPSLPEIKYPKEKCPVEIVDKEGCTRYIGTVIKDVKVAKAPQAMQQRLAAIGLRPINNIVDITNFCLMETGQPLHAFDYDKLEGGKIIVRRAKKGETIITIDGELRELDPSVLVIADAKRPVAIAGVMGGQETEVTGKTKNILLESAYFDPVLIRRAARKSGLSSDSSYRFERGVDFQMVENGCTRAIALIQELAGGEIEQRQDLCLAKKKKVGKAVTVSLAQINGLLGAALTTTQCKTILKKLEFDVVSKKGQPLPGDRPQILKVTPPTFRNDIHQAVDVVEEVARVVGYDNLPLSLPHITVSNVPAKNTR
ncbi:MAG: phenylalanine--tRNA ligase subunit beta, partial [Candidatus Omnitrophica bacterium]|nr:phenylalanine--tRNA ligase subunit beta [Candidatus Omnitrophota bacterium]